MENLERKQELDVFLLRCEEFIESKYILANVKIVNLLKAIASSETLLSIFRACLTDFNYEATLEKCFKPSRYISGKFDYVSPDKAKDLLALVFNLLMDFDSGKIDFNSFLNENFYSSGSFYESYDLFIKKMIVPFKFTVKSLTEGVISGTVSDPAEEILRSVLTEDEVKKVSPEVKDATDLLNEDIEKLKGKLNQLKNENGEDPGLTEAETAKKEKLEEAVFVTETFVAAINSGDKSAIKYAYIAYKYTIKAVLPIFNSSKKIEKLKTALIKE